MAVMFGFAEKNNKHFLIISHHVQQMIFHRSDKRTINVLIASVQHALQNRTTQIFITVSTFQQNHSICRMSTGSE